MAARCSRVHRAFFAGAKVGCRVPIRRIGAGQATCGITTGCAFIITGFFIFIFIFKVDTE